MSQGGDTHDKETPWTMVRKMLTLLCTTEPAQSVYKNLSCEKMKQGTKGATFSGRASPAPPPPTEPAPTVALRTNRFSARSMKPLKFAICSETSLRVGGNFGFDKGFLDCIRASGVVEDRCTCRASPP